jgi:hypothetical protein
MMDSTHTGTPKFAQREQDRNLTRAPATLWEGNFGDFLNKNEEKENVVTTVTTCADVGDSNELQKTPTLQ